MLYEIKREPSPQQFRDLLRSLLPFAQQLGLIVKPNESQKGQAVLAKLAPSAIETRFVQSWPGTSLPPGHEVEQRIYSFDSRSVDILFRYSSGISEWSWPMMPEDLHLLREDGSTLLGSIASHQVSWLEFRDEEYSRWELTTPQSVLALISELVDVRGFVTPIGVVADFRDDERLRLGLQKLDRSVQPELRESIAHYLAGGHVIQWQPPGATVDVIGSRFTVEGGGDVLTDGKYYWRRDYAHYVATYGFEVDAAAVKHMQDIRWQNPPLSEEELEEIANYLWSH